MKITRSAVSKAALVTWGISLVFAFVGFFLDHNSLEYKLGDIGWWVASLTSLALFVYYHMGRFNDG